ncbi:MAG: LysR family transcriptional regulator [Cyanothece sp. SIO1E1]|nr:LysR family transcriptional regulator [Cyanothece sp. SIO1E1]
MRYLRAFLELAEELHFQRAARHLGITQPTLSQQIKTLEEELGVTLFARDRSGVDLTPAGVAFQNSIEPLLNELQRAVDEVREIENGRSREIRIGTGDYLNVQSIHRSVAKLRASHPDWTIEIRHLPTTETFPAVKEKEVDIGFGPLPVTHPALIAKTVVTGRWEAVLSPGHALAENVEVSLKQLKNQPLIIFDKALNPSLYSGWLQRFEGAGYSPRIVYETRQIQTGLQMTEELGAIYVIASYLLPDRLEGLERRPLCGFDNEIAVGAAWREDNESTALAEYLKILRQEIADSDGLM